MEMRYWFRGTRIDIGEWMIGNLIQTDDGVYIIQNYVPQYLIKHYEVVPSTICQCTGLRDKNGKLIWENDIVKFEDCGEEGYEYKEGFDFENKARVEFTEGRWSLTDFVSDNSAVIDGMYDHAEFMDLWGECEVIGNKFDNPELLEV